MIYSQLNVKISLLPNIPGPGQLDFLEHGADQGVDPLRPPLPGIFNWFPSSILNCFAIALQFSQSMVHTLFLGELKLKNLLIMIGETAPGSDVPVLVLSILDLAPRLVGLSIDIAIASDFPLERCHDNYNLSIHSLFILSQFTAFEIYRIP